MSSGQLAGALAVVREATVADADRLPDAGVVAELVALRRLADAAEAAYLARLRTFHARGLADAEVLSTRSWVRRHLHVAPAETSKALRIGQGVAGLPVVAAALAEGSIRIPHVAAIVDAAALLGPEVIAGVQDPLVEAAGLDDPTRLRAALRGYGAAVDNPAAAKAARRRAEGRWLDLATTFAGAVALQGVLPAEDGGIVTAAIDALASPHGAEDTRTAGQRRADALVELCSRALNSQSLPDNGGEPPQLSVLTDLATLQARRGGFGELPDGSVLAGETVRRLACDAKITRIVLDGASQPLDVGRARRTVTAAQRRALRVRDGGCRFPGCDRPVEWTDAHHVRWWSRGGRTDIGELILLCRTHHTAVHEGGWHIRLFGPGQFLFLNPAGHLVFDHTPRATRTLITRLIDHPRAGPDPPDQTAPDQYDIA